MQTQTDVPTQNGTQTDVQNGGFLITLSPQQSQTLRAMLAQGETGIAFLTMPAPHPPAEPELAPEPQPEPALPVTRYETGLFASYFRGTALEGEAVVSRIENASLQFNAAKGQLVPELGAQKWSARYQGFLSAPITGTLKLWTLADDGARLFVSGALVIDDWKTHAPKWSGTTIDVEQGQLVPIAIEYFQGAGGARLELHWEYQGQPRALVPAEALLHQL